MRSSNTIQGRADYQSTHKDVLMSLSLGERSERVSLISLSYTAIEKKEKRSKTRESCCILRRDKIKHVSRSRAKINRLSFSIGSLRQGLSSTIYHLPESGKTKKKCMGNQCTLHVMLDPFFFGCGCHCYGSASTQLDH